MKTSLFYVPSPDQNGQINIQRLADWNRTNQCFDEFNPPATPAVQNDGELVETCAGVLPIRPNPKQSPILTNHRIGVWDWHANANGRVFLDRFRDDLKPVQVLSNFRNRNITILSIANHLRARGVQATLYTDHLAVLTMSGAGFILSKGDLLQWAPTILLKQNVDLASAIPRVDILTLELKQQQRNRFTTVEKIEVLANKLPNTHNKVLLHDKTCIVQNFIKEVFAKGGPLNPAELAKREGLSMPVAQKALEQFKNQISSIALNGWNTDFIELAFDKNDGFRAKCLNELKNQWEAQNTTRIAQEQEKLDAIKQDLSGKESELLTKNQQIAEKDREIAEKQSTFEYLKREINAANELLNETKKQAEDAEDAVKARLDAIRADIPKAFAEFSILRQVLSPIESDPKKETGFSPFCRTETATAFTDISPAFEALAGNLQRCGCIEDKAKIAAIYLLACAIRKQPLLIVGSHAESFAEAISMATAGGEPAVLDGLCSNVIESERALLSAKPPVCVVRSPFSPNLSLRLPGLIERARGTTQFLACTPFHEDLRIEPKSFFFTMFPFFTDVFATSGIETGDMAWTAGDLSSISMQAIASSESIPFPGDDNLQMSLVAENKFGCIRSTMVKIIQANNPDKAVQQAILDAMQPSVYPFLLPMAVATGKDALVQSIVENAGNYWSLQQFLP